MSTASRFRSPKESRILKYPAVGSHSGHLGVRSTGRHSLDGDRFIFDRYVARTSHFGIRNLPRKQRVTIQRETMAIRLLNNEYKSPKRIKRITKRLSKQICLLKRAA